jgi:hypothetical protein
MGDVEGGVRERNLGRQRGARIGGRDLLGRDHRDGLEAGRRVKSRDVAVRADHEASVDGGRDVVGMALDPRCPLEDLVSPERQLVHVVGGHEPGHDRGCARAEAGRERDLRVHPERKAIDVVQVGEAAHAQVGVVGGQVLPPGVDRELPGLLDLELEVDRDGRGHRVEAGTEVRRRAGDAHPAPASHQPNTARSTAARSGSHGITGGAA